MAFPFYNKVESIKVEMDSSMKDVMNSLMFGQAGAVGAPMPFVTSQGEATNRSTLATQKENFELNIQSYIDNFDEDWNNQIMNKVADINGFEPAQIVSERISLGDKLEFSQRISTYLLNGLMSNTNIDLSSGVLTLNGGIYQIEMIGDDLIVYPREK